MKTNAKTHARDILRIVLALAMGTAGVGHFVNPATFVSMVPPALPSPLALVYISGVAEIAGGLGLLVPWPRLRQLASFGLIAL
ncbi:MAG TPA: DoxX family protein, partial [Methylocystis sp.]